MERRPEDIAADPVLRQEYVGQESFDEWIERMAAGLEAQGNLELAEKLRQHDYPEVTEVWARHLDPNTRFAEVLYLRGHTDKGARDAVSDQFQASLRDAAIRKGFMKESDFIEIKED